MSMRSVLFRGLALLKLQETGSRAKCLRCYYKRKGIVVDTMPYLPRESPRAKLPKRNSLPVMSFLAAESWAKWTMGEWARLWGKLFRPAA